MNLDDVSVDRAVISLEDIPWTNDEEAQVREAVEELDATPNDDLRELVEQLRLKADEYDALNAEWTEQIRRDYENAADELESLIE